jgi:NADPH2:quinone reductase
MTKAVLIESPGGPERLVVKTIADTSPGPGQARVRHRAVGINYIDVYHRSGLYPLPAYPSGIGLEGSGVVEAVGEGVTDVRVGDRVAYAGGSVGAYAEARTLAVDRLVKLPDAIDDESAAAMMLKGMTVECLIRRVFPVKSGQTVLWHAAAGGVGLIACQWLRHLGVRVIGTVSSPEKAELARAHGCAETILYTQQDFVERVHALTAGAKLPVVYDSVGKATFLGSLDCLQPRGMYVGFGNASGKPEPFDITQLASKGSLYVTRPTFFTYTASRADLLASAAGLFDAVTSGAVKIHVSRRFALSEAREAHAHLESRQSSGSLLLMP